MIGTYSAGRSVSADCREQRRGFTSTRRSASFHRVTQAGRFSATLDMSNKRFCIVSDLDHTMVDHQGKPMYQSILEFNWLWMSKYRHDSFLVYSTGRSFASYEDLCRSTPLLTPDLLICSVGTEIFEWTEQGRRKDESWHKVLDQLWDRKAIAQVVAKRFPALKPQPESEQRPHKVSFHLQEVDEPAEDYVQKLRDELSRAGLRAKVIYSGGVDVDVLAEAASKGLALQYLQRQWSKSGSKCPIIQVNGDSGNDAELFEAPDVYGCIVSNAMPELIKWAEEHPSPNVLRASRRCAEGIIETMYHFQLVPADEDLPPEARANSALVGLYAGQTRWLHGLVDNDDDAFDGQVAIHLSSTFTSKDAGGGCVERTAFLDQLRRQHGSKSERPCPCWVDELQFRQAERGSSRWRVTFRVNSLDNCAFLEGPHLLAEIDVSPGTASICSIAPAPPSTPDSSDRA